MKYMLLIYGNDETWDRLYADLPALRAAHKTLADDLRANGELIGTNGLTTEDSRVVRVRDGVPAVTDGPFSEAKEVLAGYYLVDCDSADRAAEIAARLPEAPYSPIEVRRVLPADFLD
jgi:hypothetical protein